MALATTSLVAAALVHKVSYWTDDAGYCKKLPGYDDGVHRPRGLDRVHAAKGDSVSFVYSTHHDVWSHPTLDALESCDYNEAVQLANRTQGGGCANEADLECMAAASPFVLQAATAGNLYLSCGVGDHCTNGQRIVVSVHETRPTPPLEVNVPLWTDDAGYCKPIPSVFPWDPVTQTGQHSGTHGLRPHGADREGGGLEPITIAFGQALVFKYSTHHDVWSHPSAESLTACDYEGATMLADRQAGGGCTNDADLTCQEQSVGFKLTPTREQVGTTLYLSCSVGDHCANGQTLVVMVIDGSDPHPVSGGSGGGGGGGGALFIFGLLLGAVVALGIKHVMDSSRRSKATAPTLSLTTAPKPGLSDDPSHAGPSV